MYAVLKIKTRKFQFSLTGTRTLINVRVHASLNVTYHCSWRIGADQPRGEMDNDHSIFPNSCARSQIQILSTFAFTICFSLFISHALSHPKHREESLGNANFELICSSPIMHQVFCVLSGLLFKESLFWASIGGTNFRQNPVSFSNSVLTFFFLGAHNFSILAD